MREITAEQAEKLIGARLDRRRRYATTDDGAPDEFGHTVFSLGSWVQPCSGCFEGGEYGGFEHLYDYDKKAGCHLGAGCDECGYTGKRRVAMWLPAQTIESDRILRAEIA